MNRTRAVDNVAVMPAPSGSTHAPGYIDVGTTSDVEWANGLTEAVCRPLEDGGVTLDTDDYDQFAVLLSGVHGTVSAVRTTLATVAVSTNSKQVASAVTDAICSGTFSQCNAGREQTASGASSQCNAGLEQTASGTSSQCNAGDQLIASGGYCQAEAGVELDNSGNYSKLACGKYAELIDDTCFAMGYAVAAPVNFHDGLTNKNLTHYFNCLTGEARHESHLKVGGSVDTGVGATFKVIGSTGLTYQPKLKKTSTVTINGGVSAAAIAWADYADEPTIEIEYQIRCTSAGETVNHGTAIQLALPASWPVEHTQTINNHIGGGVSGAYWHANVDCTANTVDLYLSGANAAYANGATQTVNLILHRCDPT